MNIIAGRFRGKKLKAPKGLDTRPVLARVREAMFNVIGDVGGLSFLDLFAGTGAVGIEALSRGAEKASFVERGDRQCSVIRENLASTFPGSRLIRSDCLKALKHMAETGEKFDIIFADPPYDKGLSQKTVTAVFKYGLLEENGILALTVRNSETMPDSVTGAQEIFNRRYGDTKLIIYGLTKPESVEECNPPES